MNCKNCGTALREGQLFCPKCGTKAEPSALCPGCGAPLDPGAKFCGVCGAPTVSAPVTPAPVTPAPAPKKKGLPGWAIALIIVGALLIVGGMVVGGLALAGVFDAPPAYVETEDEEDEDEDEKEARPSPTPTTAPAPAFAPDELGCASGNIHNMGWMTFDGEYIYYVHDGAYFEDNDIGLRRSKPDGSEVTMLVPEVNASFIQVQGDSLYYYDDSYAAIKTLPCDGGEPETLVDAAVSTMQVTEDYLYYSDYNDCAIFRIPLSGGDPESIVDVYCYSFWVTEQNELVYMDYDLDELHALDLDTGDDRLLYESYFSHMAVEDGYVYAFDLYDEFILSVNIATGETQELFSREDIEYLSAFNLYDGYIYFAKESEMGLLRIPVTGGDSQVMLEDDYAYHIYALNDTVYVLSGGGVYAASGQQLADGDFELIVGGSPAPAPATPAPDYDMTDDALFEYLCDSWVATVDNGSGYECFTLSENGSIVLWYAESPDGYGEHLLTAEGSWYVEDGYVYITIEETGRYSVYIVSDDYFTFSYVDDGWSQDYIRMD